MMFAVAVGNAFDGVILYGPFDEHDDAVEWADKHWDEWNVVRIEFALL